jgi:ADP-heptose:LPS heptosyltransferase
VRNIAFLRATGARFRVAPDITGGAYLLTHALRPSGTLKHLADSQRLVLEALGGMLPSPHLTVADSDREWANECISELAGVRPVVAIHPGTSRESKHWLPERFARLAEIMDQRFGATIVLVLGPSDASLGESIIAQCHTPLHAIRPSIRQLPALLQRCSLLVGLDSASAHIAGAVGTPSVLLFGPSDPDLARPLGGRNAIVLKEGFPCRPCGLGSCPLGVDRSCMAAITVDDVLREVETYLGGQYKA